ncbi:MAG: ribonuclease H-like domain-containing protein [Candidatus Nanopelagicaceae bacterium]|nr:ribonuclease H-like domain-containing protein [Candidatus Nanopelagicaceae bacterium]
MRLDARAALQCHEYLHKSFAPACFDLTDRAPDSAMMLELKRQGDIHEARVIEYLLTKNPDVLVINKDQGEIEKELTTAEALINSTAQIIIGAWISSVCEEKIAELTGRPKLSDPDRVSRPDLLVRVGEGADGKPRWAPVDIKSHEPIKENKSSKIYLSTWDSLLPTQGVESTARLELEDASQLAHYHEHLRTLGLATDEGYVAIIGRDIEQIVWAKLAETALGLAGKDGDAGTDYLFKFDAAKQVVAAARARQKDPSLPPAAHSALEGDAKFGCPACPFQIICERELKAHDGGAGHVTLLAGVTKKAQAKYFPDITSIRELAATAGLPKPAEKLQIQAQAWVSNKAILIDPDKDFLIPEFDIEIDIDLENSMAVFQDSGLIEVEGKDRVYLYGYGVHDRTINKDWHSATFDSFADYSNTEEGEYQLLLKTWNFLQDQVASAEAAGKTIGIFHYSSHEKTWWRNFARNHEGKPGVPTLLEVEGFIKGYFKDLLDYSKLVALGTSGYGIKKLAPKAGFNWQVQDPGGALSLLKYKEAVDQNRTQAERDKAIAWLYSYNLDDVRATFAVREYLRKLSF